MNRLLLALSLVVALGSTSLGAASQTKITGDTFVIDEASGTATFSGNVVVERTGLTVWAAKVLIEYGDGGPEDVRTFTATGRVRIKTPDQDATGDRDVGLGERDARWRAVDHATDGRAVTFTPARKPEKSAEAVAGHGSRPTRPRSCRATRRSAWPTRY